MFRQLAASINPNFNVSGPSVFRLHPMQLARFLEEVWIRRVPPPALPAPSLLEVPAPLIAQEATSGITPLPGRGRALWDHLIYAYLVENTRIYEIFRRVLEEFLYGERLGTPTDATHRWLRTTEQLFYAADAPYQIFSLSSFVRPDSRATRRNAYFRMFGIDLNHGTDDNRPYPYPRSPQSNTEFVPTWEEFLREVWIGIENFTTTSGPRPTDDATIARLARSMDDMLSTRRIAGNLTRDELEHVSTMSWFHLTLSFNSPIVLDLEAQANSAEERLMKVGARVGLPAHSQSGAYFRLADNMSVLLRGIEMAMYNTTAGARLLYQPSPPAPAPPPGQTLLSDRMREIIRDWSIAAGRDMKSRRVSLAAPQPTPVRPMPRPIVPVPPSTDGRVTTSREPVPT